MACIVGFSSTKNPKFNKYVPLFLTVIHIIINHAMNNKNSFNKYLEEENSISKYIWKSGNVSQGLAVT